VRLDHKLGEKDSLFGRYSLQDTQRFLPSVFNNFGSGTQIRMQHSTINHVHLFDARKINEFRVGYNRPAGGTRFNQRFGQDLISPLGIEGILPVSNPAFVSRPAINIAGFAGVGAPYFSPVADFSNFFDYIDNFGKNILD
jgi:hypothetical protein